MSGTIRTFDEEMRNDIHQRVKATAEMIAKSAGATAEVKIDKTYPVTINDTGLTEQVAPALNRAAGVENVSLSAKITGSEDFSFFQHRVPGFFFLLGVTPKGTDLNKAAPNHSPHFFVDESALLTGVRAMSYLAVEYLHAK
jgi:amidohydrolase